MESQVQKLLDALGDLRQRANANAVFGKPVSAGERTIIPVAEVTYDFDLELEEDAAAASEGEGGGGMRVRPMAVVEVTSQHTGVKPIINEQQLALAGALLIGWAVFWIAWALRQIFGQRE